MRRRSNLWLLPVGLTTTVIIFVACGTGDPSVPSNASPTSSSSASSSSGGTIDGSTDGTALTDARPPPVRAPFGLDTRPSNTSCVAGARPITTAPGSSVTFRKYYDDPSADFSVQPMMMSMPPNDSSHFYLARRTGELERFSINSPQTRTTVANLTTLSGILVGAGGEGGFLGFAFHPRFGSGSDRVYVSWTGYDTPQPNDLRSHVGCHRTTSRGSHRVRRRFCPPKCVE